MHLDERIELLSQLGSHLLGPEDEFLTALMKRTEFNNGWFSLEQQQRALQTVSRQLLDRDKLREWVGDYSLPAPAAPPERTVGLVLAGNIPLVGIHDLVSVFVAGHHAQIKLSSKDPYVLPYLIKVMVRLNPAAEPYFQIVNNLSGFDAIIATGSNNSARYFEAYFGHYPHIIRRNRNAVAVLTGEETEEQLRGLGDDIFSYFGLGCRNVSKIYVPEGYDFNPLLEVLHEWRHLQNHTKWKNNFDYNFALLTLNKEHFLHNGSIILREDTGMASHIAGLYYEYYHDLGAVARVLRNRSEEIQLVVAQPGLLAQPATYPFGTAQQPGLADYADGVDTLSFLTTGLSQTAG
ncbi:acyl-CoA reductase [Neolewinella litorea]|uniref:Acyl-CoA reductase n=1 Tax=Neolewinella litorea TaxID=2562452 RepID=A0A4S4NTG6_9BACT|nr:acyl-CoA reductase [Neolewinella litorea]THH41781.1 acyl-CoA reductase [Neolewinella litorea]